MAPRRDAVIAAGMAFADSSHPADELFTINFNERVWPGLPPGQRFTSDQGALRKALARSTARGQTALFDAMLTRLRHLDDGTQPRKVLILVSDGGDNASRDAVRRRPRRRAAPRRRHLHHRPRTIATTARPSPACSRAGRRHRRRGVLPARQRRRHAGPERIARDIRSSYTIGYAPPDGTTRRPPSPDRGRSPGARSRQVQGSRPLAVCCPGGWPCALAAVRSCDARGVAVAGDRTASRSAGSRAARFTRPANRRRSRAS